MKKALSLILALVLIVGVTACGGDCDCIIIDNPPPANGEDNPPANGEDNTISITDERISEIELLFRAFLDAYIAGDEKTFKNYMSEKLYNEYLEYQTNPPVGEDFFSSSIAFLDEIVDDREVDFSVYNAHVPEIHNPGITFFTRLMRESDFDDAYQLGTKFLVNISYDEDDVFAVNRMGLEQ